MIVLHSDSMNSIPRNSGVSNRRLAISNRGSGAMSGTIEHMFEPGNPPRSRRTRPRLLPVTIWLVRHGETEWSISGQHTGSTDIPLTAQGRLQAVAIGKLLAGRTFDHVFSSPMGRAVETGTLAGFGERIQLDDRLCEFDYGEFEGLTTVQDR